MDQYEYMILKACKTYINSELIHSEDLINLIETIFSIKEYEKNEKMDT